MSRYRRADGRRLLAERRPAHGLSVRAARAGWPRSRAFSEGPRLPDSGGGDSSLPLRCTQRRYMTTTKKTAERLIKKYPNR
ncbi:hypothetical protein FVP46_02170, partial [Mycobacterium tuberculosis]|nr:hypothetical protein [Mycobacterium tuberculosis]